jgi:DNA-binding NarL/FixJ family response regulator
MMVFAIGFQAEVFSQPSEMEQGVVGLHDRFGQQRGLLTCLVVSGDASRRERLVAAASLAGWNRSTVPEDAATLHTAASHDVSLAIIDIASPVGERVHDTLELAEELAARPNTLVVICGSEDNADEELWARQLGVWLYLPGVADGDSLASLCIEARRLQEPIGSQALHPLRPVMPPAPRPQASPSLTAAASSGLAIPPPA